MPRKWTEAEVFQVLLDAIREAAPRAASSEITPDSDLILEVGLDSFELVEMILLVETELDVSLELNDELFENVSSAGQLAKMLTSFTGQS